MEEELDPFRSCNPPAAAAADPCGASSAYDVMDGMVNESTCYYPDLYKMIGTAQHKLTQEEIKLCADSFDEMFAY